MQLNNVVRGKLALIRGPAISRLRQTFREPIRGVVGVSGLVIGPLGLWMGVKPVFFI